MVTAIQEANAWRGFLLTLFSEDELERSRPGEWTPFPRGARGDSTVTRAQFDIAFTAIKKLKMTGADETPIEAFAASEELKDELFFLTQLVWGTELTPARLNLIVQFMLYKGGGKNPEDRKSYRPLSMINHARKLMAMILLMNLASNGRGEFHRREGSSTTSGSGKVQYNNGNLLTKRRRPCATSRRLNYNDKWHCAERARRRQRHGMQHHH